MILSLKNLKVERIPSLPGVYFFLGPRRKILYIGKAANLRARLRGYFGAAPGEKTKLLLEEAEKIKFISTDSEIEALLEEAHAIKKLRPKYNVLWRDDKNYFFVGITKETFPRIFLTHQIQRARGKPSAREMTFIGPFVSGRALRHTLRMLRELFLYCTCRKPHARVCLSAQLTLCPGYCCEIGRTHTPRDVKAYQENIRSIVWILTGRGAALQNRLRKEIQESARRAAFERAHFLKHQLENLEKIFAHKGLIESVSLVRDTESTPTPEALGGLLGTGPVERIEGYDISMISGDAAVGAMVSFAHGIAEKGDWRLFRIKTASPTNDPGMMAEVISRRFSHPEWQFPDLIIVDGGKTQRAAARAALHKKHLAIPLAAIAKGRGRTHDTLLFGEPVRAILFTKLPEPVALYFKKIRDAAHQFVLSFHRRRRRKTLL